MKIKKVSKMKHKKANSFLKLNWYKSNLKDTNLVIDLVLAFLIIFVLFI